jgi:predicted NAD-dependent protein-ADP-ribosyltransferase YbiA (DUF1768 family)
MIARMRKGLLILEHQEGEPDDLDAWLDVHAGQVFRLRKTRDGALSFHTMGPEDEACRIPINISSRSPGPLRAISNFAEAHFILDGMEYMSVEGYWQGLKFPDESDRRRLAALYGSKAKDAGYYAPKSDIVIYAGQAVRVGTWDHWQLMEKACTAKFEQCTAARTALLSTGMRPLAHQMRRDSRTIPGVLMADIWMRIRDGIQKRNRTAEAPRRRASAS